MKKVLIDTNIYSYAMKGEPETITVLQQSHEIGICAVSIGKLLSGFKAGDRELEEFLDTPRVKIYSIDEDTAEFYAEVLNSLKENEKPIPTNDIWIASVALQYGLKLFSKDQHFKYVSGLILII